MFESETGLILKGPDTFTQRSHEGKSAQRLKNAKHESLEIIKGISYIIDYINAWLTFTHMLLMLQ